MWNWISIGCLSHHEPAPKTTTNKEKRWLMSSQNKKKCQGFLALSRWSRGPRISRRMPRCSQNSSRVRPPLHSALGRSRGTRSRHLPGTKRGRASPVSSSAPGWMGVGKARNVTLLHFAKGCWDLNFLPNGFCRNYSATKGNSLLFTFSRGADSATEVTGVTFAPWRRCMPAGTACRRQASKRPRQRRRWQQRRPPRQQSQLVMRLLRIGHEPTP